MLVFDAVSMQSLRGCMFVQDIAGCARVNVCVRAAERFWSYCGCVEFIFVVVHGAIDAGAWFTFDGGAAFGAWIA